MEDCKSVIRIPQYTGTCWFNALLMGCFYSDAMRNAVKSHLNAIRIPPEFKKTPQGRIASQLYGVIREIVTNRFESSDPETFRYFEKITPEYLLNTLHELDPETFFRHGEVNTGGHSDSYFEHLLGLFHIRVATVVRPTPPGQSDVDVVLVIVPAGERIQPQFTHNGIDMPVDCVFLTNYANKHDGLHEIVGLTCKGKRYVYNGWAAYTKDPGMTDTTSSSAPCELMKYDWLAQQGNDFCLSTKLCKLDTDIDGRMCFNFGEGYRCAAYVHPKYRQVVSLPPITPVSKPGRAAHPVDPNCVRRAANSPMSRALMFDSNTFDALHVSSNLSWTSPKVAQLVETIRQLDASDKDQHGTLFKHVIYCDVAPSQGAKYVMSALHASGFELVQKPQGKSIVYEARKGDNNVAILTASSVYQEKITVKHKKEILSVYNSRPDNVYGSHIRILVLDSAYKEGLDVFDVKYMHMLEELTSDADRKQVMGRGTRMCGQKGLPFESGVGWKLHVFTYHMNIPRERRVYFGMSKTLHDYYMSNTGTQPALLEFGNALEDTLHYGSMDYLLTESMHTPPGDDAGIDQPVAYCTPIRKAFQAGGAAGSVREMQIKWLEQDSAQPFVCGFKRPTRSLPVYTEDLFLIMLMHGDSSDVQYGTRGEACSALKENPDLVWHLKRFISEGRPELPPPVKKDLQQKIRFLRKHKRITASRAAGIRRAAGITSKRVKPTPTPTPAPADAPEYVRVQLDIASKFKRYKWGRGEITNGCVETPKRRGGSSIVFSPTQNLIADAFTPDAPQKGMLLYHSVGTGKTATAIHTASKHWQDAGYTVLWVTRSSLKSDVAKNLYGPMSAHARVLGRGAPAGAQDNKRLLGDEWSIPTMSYKQFSNALQGRNSIYQDLIKKNGGKDVLRKTIVVVDEAHKLFATENVPASELHNIEAIKAAIRHSYKASGKHSVRLLLMTATPFTKDPMNAVRLLNMTTAQPVTEEFDEFHLQYLAESGRFTRPGREAFLNAFAGNVSYLNRSADPRQFAQPIYYQRYADMSLLTEDPGEIHTITGYEKNKAYVQELKGKLQKDVYVHDLGMYSTAALEHYDSKISSTEDLIKEVDNAMSVLSRGIPEYKDLAKLKREIKALLASYKKHRQDVKKLVRNSQAKTKETVKEVSQKLARFRATMESNQVTETALLRCYKNPDGTSKF